MLEALGARNAELSLLVVADQEMAELNQRYLKRSGPTNVIAFPMHEGPFGEINPNLLGDVVICIDRAAKEAHAYGIAEELRFDQLLVHGILHLFGFDHEADPQDAEAMRDKEKALLGLIQSEKRL